jgi:hypothetical protein
MFEIRDCVGTFYLKIYEIPDSGWAQPFLSMATYRNTFEVVFPKEGPKMLQLTIKITSCSCAEYRSFTGNVNVSILV